MKDIPVNRSLECSRVICSSAVQKFIALFKNRQICEKYKNTETWKMAESKN